MPYSTALLWYFARYSSSFSLWLVSGGRAELASAADQKAGDPADLRGAHFVTTASTSRDFPVWIGAAVQALGRGRRCAQRGKGVLNGLLVAGSGLGMGEEMAGSDGAVAHTRVGSGGWLTLCGTRNSEVLDTCAGARAAAQRSRSCVAAAK